MDHNQEKIHILALLIATTESVALDTSILQKEADRNIILHAQSQLLNREAYWVYTLYNLEPHGLK